MKKINIFRLVPILLLSACSIREANELSISRIPGSACFSIETTSLFLVPAKSSALLPIYISRCPGAMPLSRDVKLTFTGMPAGMSIEGSTVLSAGYPPASRIFRITNNSTAVLTGHKITITTDHSNVSGTSFNLFVPARQTTIAAGNGHDLAVNRVGRVIAWGENRRGETNVPLKAQSNIVSVAAGSGHSLALSAAGEVVAWGLNDHGQTTVPLEAQSDVVAISAGDSHSLALTKTGKVIAWGANYSGQTNVPLEAEANIVAISTGSANNYNFALTKFGKVIAWGAHWKDPAKIPLEAKSNIVAISAGAVCDLALTAAGKVIDLEGNSVPLEAQSNIKAIAGGSRCLALTNAGEVVVWGEGIGIVPPRALNNIAAISSSDIEGWSFALTSAGEIIAWGVSASPRNPPVSLIAMLPTY